MKPAEPTKTGRADRGRRNTRGDAEALNPGVSRARGRGGRGGGGVGAGEFVWPDAADAPAHGAQVAGDEAVAGAVGGDLFPPEGGVCFRRRGVEGAAGSEAAVDEDGEAVRAGDEVRFHAEGASVSSPQDGVRDHGAQGEKLGCFFSSQAITSSRSSRAKAASSFASLALTCPGASYSAVLRLARQVSR